MHPFPFRRVFSGLTCLLLAGLLTLPSTAAYGNEGSLQAFQSTSSVYYSGIGEVSGPGLEPTELPTRTDNFDEAPVFSGGEIRFLANTSTEQQQLSGVFRSSDGKVLVVDGGVAADTEHLISVLQEYGGTVAYKTFRPDPYPEYLFSFPGGGLVRGSGPGGPAHGGKSPGCP